MPIEIWLHRGNRYVGITGELCEQFSLAYRIGVEPIGDYATVLDLMLAGF